MSRSIAIIAAVFVVLLGAWFFLMSPDAGDTVVPETGAATTTTPGN